MDSRDYIWTYWPNRQKNAHALFDLACLALSVAFVSRYATARAVYTDNEGARRIERFGIPVPTRVTLDSLSSQHPGKFALAKIDTYSRIDTPCTHIDYDVFLARMQIDSAADFCCQSLEDGGIFKGTYEAIHDCFLDEGGTLPPEMQPYSAARDFKGYNMGYVQIRNIEFLHKYAAVSRPIFDQMVTLDYGNNALPEQYLFYCMAHAENISVDVLFQESLWDEPTRDRHHASNGYTHFMGKKQRMKKRLFQRVLEKLEQLAPAIHDAISAEVDWSAYPETRAPRPRRPCDICLTVVHDRFSRAAAGFSPFILERIRPQQAFTAEPECEVCW